MRYYLPDEDKLFKKIQKIPIEHLKKEEQLNNNIENLTCCSYSIINYKLRPIKNNTNLKGIYYCKFRNRYKVRFNVNRNHPLTYYKDNDINLLLKIVKLLVCYLKKEYKTFLLNVHGILLKTLLNHISYLRFLVLEDIC